MVILWTYNPLERHTRLENEALKSRRKHIIQLQVIVEIVCATSPDLLVVVIQSYIVHYSTLRSKNIWYQMHAFLTFKRYKTLISAVDYCTNDGHVLLSLMSSYKYDKEVVDYTLKQRNSTATSSWRHWSWGIKLLINFLKN